MPMMTATAAMPSIDATAVTPVLARLPFEDFADSDLALDSALDCDFEELLDDIPLPLPVLELLLDPFDDPATDG